MPDDLFAERTLYPYAVTYGWPGMLTTTKIVDLQREVKVGKSDSVRPRPRKCFMIGSDP